MQVAAANVSLLVCLQKLSTVTLTFLNLDQMPLFNTTKGLKGLSIDLHAASNKSEVSRDFYNVTALISPTRPVLEDAAT